MLAVRFVKEMWLYFRRHESFFHELKKILLRGEREKIYFMCSAFESSHEKEKKKSLKISMNVSWKKIYYTKEPRSEYALGQW